MNRNAIEHASLTFGAMLLLGACSSHLLNTTSEDSEVNAYPKNYKADILAAMHVYLNDPTQIRDAAISTPELKQAGGQTRYMACVKFNPKKNNTEYAGIRELAAVYLVGRFDHFIETPKSECAGATYTPFPELEKLPP